MVKTKLGQHFLVDKNIVEKELAHANLNADDIVLEIGPGKGVLTKELAKQCKQVIAVELDTSLSLVLKRTLPKNVLVINEDIMKLDWKSLPKFTKVVANLPFQISSPFTFKLLTVDFEKAVLIYQKEFAQRMIAKPGSKHYSRLSVGISYNASCQLITHIPPSSFSPHPKVYSSLVELIPYSIPPFDVNDEQFFFELTHLLFSHRRKQIKTIIKNVFSKSIAEQISYGSKRVEVLSPKQIAMLSKELLPYKENLNS